MTRRGCASHTSDKPMRLQAGDDIQKSSRIGERCLARAVRIAGRFRSVWIVLLLRRPALADSEKTRQSYRHDGVNAASLTPRVPFLRLGSRCTRDIQKGGRVVGLSILAQYPTQ